MHNEGGYDRHITCGAYEFRDCLQGLKDTDTKDPMFKVIVVDILLIILTWQESCLIMISPSVALYAARL
jgi:hypothetical protein